MRPKLSRKLILTNLALLAGVVILGAASIWGLFGLRESVSEAVHEYEELRLIERVYRDLVAGHASAVGKVGSPEETLVRLDAAIDGLGLFLNYQATEESPDESHQERERDIGEAVVADLKTARTLLAAPAGRSIAEEDRREAIAAVERALGDIERLVRQTDVADASESATARTRLTLIVVAGLTVAIVLMACAMSVIGYRTVMSPLRRLQSSVRKIAAGDLSQRLADEHDREFAELADDFNRMTDELESLYRDLEQKVASRSRELVRSERLASVGFLAAGVAHEISTPLNIITGYAELTLKSLGGGDGTAAGGEARRNLELICEEAFRCKSIIRQLLSLSRISDESRGDVSLARIARDVSIMLQGIKKYRNRTLEVNCPGDDDLVMTGNDVELTQVLLNLAVNALEAVDPDRGRVVLDAGRENGVVRVAVTDNGCGMTPDLIQQVFEPFFTHREKGQTRGTGLGLSVSHAIVQSHGGRISAESDGPGRGSRFVVEFPLSSGDPPHGSD